MVCLLFTGGYIGPLHPSSSCHWPFCQPSYIIAEGQVDIGILMDRSMDSLPSGFIKHGWKMDYLPMLVSPMDSWKPWTIVAGILKNCHFLFNPEFHWPECLNDGFVTRRLVIP